MPPSCGVGGESGKFRDQRMCVRANCNKFTGRIIGKTEAVVVWTGDERKRRVEK